MVLYRKLEIYKYSIKTSERRIKRIALRLVNPNATDIKEYWHFHLPPLNNGIRVTWTHLYFFEGRHFIPFSADEDYGLILCLDKLTPYEGTIHWLK